jgi:hypothetical protein
MVARRTRLDRLQLDPTADQIDVRRAWMDWILDAHRIELGREKKRSNLPPLQRLCLHAQTPLSTSSVALAAQSQNSPPGLPLRGNRLQQASCALGGPYGQRSPGTRPYSMPLGAVSPSRGPVQGGGSAHGDSAGTTRGCSMEALSATGMCVRDAAARVSITEATNVVAKGSTIELPKHLSLLARVRPRSAEDLATNGSMPGPTGRQRPSLCPGSGRQ